MAMENNSRGDNKVQDLQALMAQFESANPELSKAIRTLGMTIDDYERILTQSRNFDIRTSNSSDGAFTSQ